MLFEDSVWWITVCLETNVMNAQSLLFEGRLPSKFVPLRKNPRQNSGECISDSLEFLQYDRMDKPKSLLGLLRVKICGSHIWQSYRLTFRG